MISTPYDTRVDAYISKAEPFAQPILERLRKIIHQTCPEVKETIKWSFPNFEYAGSVLCYFASFKQHCVFGFRNAEAMEDPDEIIKPIGKTAMGSLGKIQNLSDLPSDTILKKYLKAAMALNQQGIKPIRKKQASSKESPEVPDFILKAFKKNKVSKINFDVLTPAKQREYLDWITEAKTETTRERRMNQMLLQLEENKTLNWKYEKRRK